MLSTVQNSSLKNTETNIIKCNKEKIYIHIYLNKKKLLATKAVRYSSSLSNSLKCPRESASIKLQGRLLQRMAAI